MDYKIGQKVWVYYRRSKKGDDKNKRKGKIIGDYNKFICIRMTSDSSEKDTWNECFLKIDLTIGEYSIEKIGGEKNNNRRIIEKLQSNTGYSQETDSLVASVH